MLFLLKMAMIFFSLQMPVGLSGDCFFPMVEINF